MIRTLSSFLLLSTLVAIFIASCKPVRDPCLEPKIVNLRAGVYRHADTGTAIIDSALTTPLLIAIDAPLTPNAFVYTTKTSKLSFTLNGNADSTMWQIQPDSSVSAPRDTLTFYYNHQLQFLSNACGYTYFYFLNRLSTTRHAIDSVFIANQAVTSAANVEHVKIYYRH